MICWFYLQELILVFIFIIKSPFKEVLLKEIIQIIKLFSPARTIHASEHSKKMSLSQGLILSTKEILFNWLIILLFCYISNY